MTKQLNRWQSDFGDAYTERNRISWQVRLPAWQTMTDGLKLRHVVEVGPNRGHNLRALYETGCVEGNLIGVEPNRNAIEFARTHYPQAAVLEGNILELPFVDNYADLVFTSGVLIHIALADLPAALSEIYRVSRKYILCVEYFAEEETVIEYRGHTDLLWKRDFKQCYLSQFIDLTVVKEGYWSAEDGFDQTHWWLFTK